MSLFSIVSWLIIIILIIYMGIFLPKKTRRKMENIEEYELTKDRIKRLRKRRKARYRNYNDEYSDDYSDEYDDYRK